MGLKIFETIALICLFSFALIFPVRVSERMTLIEKLSYVCCMLFVALGLCFAITLIYG